MAAALAASSLESNTSLFGFGRGERRREAFVIFWNEILFQVLQDVMQCRARTDRCTRMHPIATMYVSQEGPPRKQEAVKNDVNLVRAFINCFCIVHPHLLFPYRRSSSEQLWVPFFLGIETFVSGAVGACHPVYERKAAGLLSVALGPSACVHHQVASRKASSKVGLLISGTLCASTFFWA